MPKRTSKQVKSAQIPSKLVGQARAALQNLPEKESLPLRTAIHQLRDSITAALVNGYSCQEIAALLQQQGISISVSTLKRYLASDRGEGGSSKNSSRFNRSSLENTSTPSSSDGEVFTLYLSDSQPQHLQELAEMYGVSPEALCQNSIEDWLTSPQIDGFNQIAEYVINKNAELYQRLA